MNIRGGIVLKKIGLETLLEYKFISNLRFEEEKNLLGFVVKNPNEDDNKYDSYIYTYDLENDELKKMTSLGEESSFEFVDGNIVFSGAREKSDKDLRDKGFKFTSYYKLPLDGGEGEKLFRLPLSVGDYKVLDEDNWIILGTVNEKLPNLMDIEKLEGEERQKAIDEGAKKIEFEKGFERLSEIPFWSDGSGFTDGNRRGLYKYNLKSGELTKLTDDKKMVNSFELAGDKIYYIYYDFTEVMEIEDKLARYDLSQDKDEEIYYEKDFGIDYANELGGEIFLIGVDMKKIGINTNPDFYILKDGKLNSITPKDFDYSICSAVNSDVRHGGNKVLVKKDDRIYFTSTQRVDTFLFSIGKDGDLKKEIDLPGSIDGFQVGDGEYYLVAMRGDNLQEVYRNNGVKEIKLTSLNDNILEEYEVSTPEYVSVECGDFELDGYIMKPIGFEEGKKYKTILQIHGGPKTAYGSVFFSEMQYLTALGYVVIYTNPRGSDGRGNEFSDIRGKYGSIDYEDLMHFTKEMAKKFDFIDEDQMGVTGGSYGGYMTNWIVGHTDYFKAAVTQRSISNWTSKYNTTDIGYYFVKDQVAATPWENIDQLWDNSPLKYADKVKTPTLIIHSEQDFRCDIDQGYQFFTALKLHGVETEMLMVRGESHGLSRDGRPKQRMERLKAMAEWFEKYI